MAQALFDALTTGEAPWSDFYVTAALGELPAIDGILFSGGVSEYIYARETAAFGDLGPDLGRAIRGEVERRGFKILEAGEGIRATVIGASQYTVQLSGETIFIPERFNSSRAQSAGLRRRGRLAGAGNRAHGGCG